MLATISVLTSVVASAVTPLSDLPSPITRDVSFLSSRVHELFANSSKGLPLPSQLLRGLAGKSQDRHHRSLAETYYFRCDEIDCDGKTMCQIEDGDFVVYAQVKELYDEATVEMNWKRTGDLSFGVSDKYVTVNENLVYERVNDPEECKTVIKVDFRRYAEDLYAESAMQCSSDTLAEYKVCIQYDVESEGFFMRETSLEIRGSIKYEHLIDCSFGNTDIYDSAKMDFAFLGRDTVDEECPQTGNIIMLVAIILVVVIGIPVGVYCCNKKKAAKPAA